MRQPPENAKQFVEALQQLDDSVPISEAEAAKLLADSELDVAGGLADTS